MNIRGHVYGRNNQPLWGAIIQLENGTISDRDGYFELDSMNDSLRLNVQYGGYQPYQKTLPDSYEGGDLNIFLEQPAGRISMPGVLPRGIDGGRILDAEGKPVAGATVIITGKDLPVEVLTSDSQGFFRIYLILGREYNRRGGKNRTYTNLVINASGHKLFDYRFRRIDKPSKRVEHDGLIVEIGFHE